MQPTISSYTFTNKENPREEGIDEYKCPELEEDKIFQTTQSCELKAMGKGCRNLKTCEAYNKQLQLQMQHPNVEWDAVHKYPEELHSTMRMIKKGIIKLPTMKKNDDNNLSH